MKNIYAFLHSSKTGATPLALATILRTQGSSPQVPGASGVFSSGGLHAGTLGGGVMEAEIEAQALEALQCSTPRLVELSLTAGLDSNGGAICGGTVLVLIEPQVERHESTFSSLVHSLEQRRSGVLATHLSRTDAGGLNIARYWVDSEDRFPLDFGRRLLEFKEELSRSPLKDKPVLLGPRAAADSTIAVEGPAGANQDDSRAADPSGREMDASSAAEHYLFLEPIVPKSRLVILGAGHIGRALCRLGGYLDFEVTVIDDRPEFANPRQLPDADTIITQRAGDALRDFAITPDAYLVIVTPGHQQDAEALRAVINSEAAYVGMIGSRRKVALMKEKFMKEGWTTESGWNRVHAPIGLDIHSETVEEIAVSIAAQLIQVRNRPGRSS